MFHGAYVSKKFWTSMKTKLINLKIQKSSIPYSQPGLSTWEAFYPAAPLRSHAGDAMDCKDRVMFLLGDEGN